MSTHAAEAGTGQREDGRPGGMARLRSALAFRNIGAVYVWLLLVALFAVWIPDLFLRVETAKTVLNEYSVTGLAALSIIIPLATGTFDLSVGAAMGLAGIVAGWLLGNTGMAPAFVILLTIMASILVGVLNAIVIVRFKIDSFIGTLATGAILGAITIGISGDEILTKRVGEGFSSLASTELLGIQLPVIYMLVLMVVIGYVLEQTVFGRYLYSTGYNADVTRLVGVNVDRMRVIALLCSGTLAGFAGVVLTSRIQAADPSNGISYLIPAFSAAFLGATQFRNGRFNPWGTVVAVLMLGTGSVGLLLAGAPRWAPEVFQGIVLIAAVSLTVVQRRPKIDRAATSTPDDPTTPAPDDPKPTLA